MTETIADRLAAVQAATDATRQAIHHVGGDITPGAGLAAFPAAVGTIRPAPYPPGDWPDLDDGFTPGTARLLAQVSEDGFENHAALSVTADGGYTVDWGNGVVEQYASGEVATHHYTWDPDGEVCSEGYQTAVVTVSAAAPITTLDLIQLPAAWADYAGYPSIWLDLLVDLPACSSLRIGQDRDVVRHTRLRRAEIRRHAATNLSTMFAYCTSLTRVPDVLDVSAATNLSSMFAYCTSLTRVPDVLGARVSISVQRANLGRAQLDKLFDTLGAAAGNQVVTISGTPGRNQCDKSVATAKGWTVAG